MTVIIYYDHMVMMAWFLRYSNLLARNLYTRWLMLSVIFH